MFNKHFHMSLQIVIVHCELVYLCKYIVFTFVNYRLSYLKYLCNITKYICEFTQIVHL